MVEKYFLIGHRGKIRELSSKEKADNNFTKAIRLGVLRRFAITSKSGKTIAFTSTKRRPVEIKISELKDLLKKIERLKR